MNKNIIKKISYAMVITLSMTLFTGHVMTTNVQAKTVKISPKSKSIYVGKSFKVKIKNTKVKKIKVTVSKKKIVTVKKSKKYTYKIKGKKAGKVTVTFRIGKKKYKCKVTVKKVKKPTTTKPVIPTPEKPTHTHKFVETERVEAKSCKEPGYILSKCSCGETKKETLEGKHTVSPWIIDKSSSTTEEGLAHKECIICHTKTEEKVLDRLPGKPLTSDGNLTEADDDETIDVEEAFK